MYLTKIEETELIAVALTTTTLVIGLYFGTKAASAEVQEWIGTPRWVVDAKALFISPLLSVLICGAALLVCLLSTWLLWTASGRSKADVSDMERSLWSAACFTSAFTLTLIVMTKRIIKAVTYYGLTRRRAAVHVTVASCLVCLSYIGLASQGNGTGSYRDARRLAGEMDKCTTLEDVYKHFNCAIGYPNGRQNKEPVFTPVTNVTNQSSKLRVEILEFTNGDWFACASVNSHGNLAGGLLVSRDSRHRTRIYFGHVCGTARIWAQDLDEVYSNAATSAWHRREVFLDR